MASLQYEKGHKENSVDLAFAVASRTFSVLVRDLEMFVSVDLLLGIFGLSIVRRELIVLASLHGGICFRRLGFAVLADAKTGVSARPAL